MHAAGRRAVQCIKTTKMMALALICLAPFVVRAENTLEKIRRTNTFVIAYSDHQLPFSARDADGKVVGYSIDICLKVADALKRDAKLPQLRVNFLEVDSEGRFAALNSGEADIECGASSNTPVRRAQYAFTVPHFFTTSRVMVRKTSGIRSWNDLRGRRVALVPGNSIEPHARARNEAGMLDIHWVEFKLEVDAAAALAGGQVDAYAQDDVLLYADRSQMKNPEEFVIVGEPLSVDPYAMMMRKSDTALKSIVDREIVRMVTDREIYAMYDKWFMAPVGQNQRPLDLPMSYLLRDSFRFPSDKVAQ